MYRNTIRTFVLLGLVAFGLTGCEGALPVVGPEGRVEVEAPSSLSAAGGAWQVVEIAHSMRGVVSATIGAEGGQLVLGDIRLVVPAGAVEAPTKFKMKKADGYLRVSLTASRFSPNDVGSKGFLEPLTLSFDYANSAVLQDDASSYAVVWIKPDGSFEPQPTTVDAEATVVHGSITHFSDYAMASN